MTTAQERAIEIIKRLPDKQVNDIIKLIAAMQKSPDPGDPTDMSSSMQAFEELQKYRKKGMIDRDYKAERNRALESKYDFAASV